MDAKSTKSPQKAPKTGQKPAKNGKKVQIRDYSFAPGRRL